MRKTHELAKSQSPNIPWQNAPTPWRMRTGPTMKQCSWAALKEVAAFCECRPLEQAHARPGYPSNEDMLTE